MTRLDKELKDSALMELLGADGIEELKSRLIDVIVEEVRYQLKSSNYYIIDPDDITELISKEAFDDIKAEVKEEYRKRIMKNFELKFSEMGWNND